MVLIGGAGLAGLSAAFYTLKNGITKNKTILCEATDRCGGWMNTHTRDGYLFEAGPRTIRPTGPAGINALHLVEHLGLEDAVRPIKMGEPAAKNRMIYAKGALHNLPNSIIDLFITRKPFTQPFVKVLWKEYRTKSGGPKEDESLNDFMERRFGKEVADYLFGALMCGICAGDSRQLSVKFMFDRLFRMEQKCGGVLRGLMSGEFKEDSSSKVRSRLADRAKEERWNVYSLEGGVETLPKRLLQAVERAGVTHLRNHRIEKIHLKETDPVEVKFQNGTTLSSDFFVSALPAFSLASAIRDDHPELSEDLDGIPFVDVAVVNLFYEQRDLLKHKAFGFLIPPVEKRPILGVIFDSCCFPSEKGTVLTVMMGGRWFEDNFGKNPKREDLLKIARSQLKDLLKITVEPEDAAVHVLRKCIPQYVVGHQKRIDRIRKYITDKKLPLTLCGSSYDGVGVNDVIMSSKNAVESIRL